MKKDIKVSYTISFSYGLKNNKQYDEKHIVIIAKEEDRKNNFPFYQKMIKEINMAINNRVSIKFSNFQFLIGDVQKRKIEPIKI